jgi:hypothetical protein
LIVLRIFCLWPYCGYQYSALVDSDDVMKGHYLNQVPGCFHFVLNHFFPLGFASLGIYLISCMASTKCFSA